MHRILKFDNILNVRDYGGHSLADGREIVLGKLFRGAQLSAMTAAEQKRLADMNISLLIDLRYLPERKRQATPLSDVFRPEIFAFEAAHDQTDPNELAPHEAFAIRELNTADDARRYMLGSYKDRPTDPGFVGLVSKSLKRMARTGEVSYVHCAAGKDRTGTFSAILLMLLGVSMDDVMAEYMRTQDAVDLDLIIPMITVKMEQRYGRSFTSTALRPYFHVEQEYLLNSLRVIGDVGTYAREVLMLSVDEIENLKGHYVR
ncbi:MAG: tyrosine-protein phosphatase [Robiginitomaculum sp.]|nr:tyrosine-protein phosphatase [Robiginitomaculum sp.]